MSALRECPFCGGEASICVGHHARYDAKIACDDCGSEGPLFGSDDYKGDAALEHRERAIAAWNARCDAGGPA